VRELTPRAIVAELDRYIVGQERAKRAVAVAVRNRWRRRQLDPSLRREITPKNIILIGPTGVGKTEIARRLASLTGAPFCKVEATKYTEVGYHGRDVESMVRDLVEAALRMVREAERERVREEAERRARERLLSLLLEPADDESGPPPEPEEDPEAPNGSGKEGGRKAKRKRTRERLAKMLDAGALEDQRVELPVDGRGPAVHVMSNVGMEQLDMDLQRMFDRLMPSGGGKARDLPVREARKVLFEQECDRLIDRDTVHERAVRLAEEEGIVFLDEIDKICGPQSSHGPDVSRQGVQRDLLPIVEGTTVQTRYGAVHTEHILFIAAGAFHVAKPSDLMPELQGRFPIRVELQDLARDEFIRILNATDSSLLKQYGMLLGTEGVTLEFTDEAIAEIAESAMRVNRSTQNIGARRLHTILERLLDDIAFDAPDRSGETVRIDDADVRRRLADLGPDADLTRFIL
jgi:ATP-dependent HslUV protease ATP-binding subunit HslU